MENTREACCKRQCDQPATLVIKIYVKDEDAPEGRPVYMPFCMTHMLNAAAIVESLVANMLTEDEDKI